MRISDEAIKEALHKHKGNITNTAKALGCCRDTIYERMTKNAELQEARANAEEYRLDLYEDAIDKAALEKGDVSAIKYVLSTRGRSRGYGEKIDVGGVSPTIIFEKEFDGL